MASILHSHQDFLIPDEAVDYLSDNIQEKAFELFSQSLTDVDKIRTAFEFVRDEIHHSADIGGHRVTKTASEVLRYGEGICYAKTMLLAALLRSQDIPAGFSYQRLTLDDTAESGFCIHALNAVYLRERNAWVRIDARGNTNGRNAQFLPREPLREQLAFPIRHDIGEKDYPFIRAKHPPEVLKPLHSYTDCRMMMQNGLPDELQTE